MTSFPRCGAVRSTPHADKEIEWHISPARFSYTDALDSILNDFERENPFLDHRKFHEGFFALKTLLKEYRRIKYTGAWQSLAAQTLQKGDTGKLVADLVQRLQILGDFRMPVADSVFSTDVLNAVNAFQIRHGLEPDGIVGPKTIAQLNVPVEERIRQILVNMERWRWVEPLTTDRYVLVNIPAFELYGYNKGKVELRMPIIVGKEASRTVIFNDEIKYIVVNPYWNIPRSIAANEMLPKLKHDANFLRDRKIEVGLNGDYNKMDVDADTIQWDTITKEILDLHSASNQEGRISSAQSSLFFRTSFQFTSTIHQHRRFLTETTDSLVTAAFGLVVLIGSRNSF